VKFISLDKNNANSQLKESVNSGMWLNDKYYIYSVRKQGIYVYDVITRKYGTIASGSDNNYELKEVKNNVIRYDNKLIKVNL
jgi:hypothetical protein